VYRRREEKDKIVLDIHFRRGCARSFIVRPYAEVALWKVERRFFFFCYILRRTKDPRVSTKARVTVGRAHEKELYAMLGLQLKRAAANHRQHPRRHAIERAWKMRWKKEKEEEEEEEEEEEIEEGRRDPQCISAIIHLRGTFQRDRASEANYTRNWSCPVSKERAFSISFRLRRSALSRVPRSVVSE